MTNVHTDSILRRRDVQTRTGLALSTRYQAMAGGRIPKATRHGPCSVSWLSSESEGRITARVAESRLGANGVRR